MSTKEKIKTELEPTSNRSHEGEFLQQVTASANTSTAVDILEKGVAGLPKNHETEHNLSLVIQTLSDLGPKDSIEAKLGLQANALYSQGMQYLSRAESQDIMCHADHYMRFALKLLKLHNDTIEALNRHRRGGEHKVVVQHVNVKDGGQAAIMAGHFKAEGGGANSKNKGTTS